MKLSMLLGLDAEPHIKNVNGYIRSLIDGKLCPVGLPTRWGISLADIPPPDKPAPRNFSNPLPAPHLGKPATRLTHLRGGVSTDLAGGEATSALMAENRGSEYLRPRSTNVFFETSTPTSPTQSELILFCSRNPPSRVLILSFVNWHIHLRSPATASFSDKDSLAKPHWHTAMVSTLSPQSRPQTPKIETRVTTQAVN